MENGKILQEMAWKALEQFEVTMDETIVSRVLEEEPGEAVLGTLRTLLLNDSLLLQIDANERSITHRLAMYLQTEFPEFHVDCEYNRDGIDPKKIGHLGTKKLWDFNSLYLLS